MVSERPNSHLLLPADAEPHSVSIWSPNKDRESMWTLTAIIAGGTLTVEAKPGGTDIPTLIVADWPVRRNHQGDAIWSYFGSPAGNALATAVEKSGSPDEWPTIRLKTCWGCRENGVWGRGDECAVCAMRAVTRCVDCGGPDRAGYMRQTRERMLGQSRCFNCLFWRDLEGDPTGIVTDNYEHYKLGSGRNPHKSARGFGGAAFVVRFKDGREVPTTDLWSQGTVPEHLRHLFVPNAEVLSGAAVNVDG